MCQYTVLVFFFLAYFTLYNRSSFKILILIAANISSQLPLFPAYSLFSGYLLLYVVCQDNSWILCSFCCYCEWHHFIIVVQLIVAALEKSIDFLDVDFVSGNLARLSYYFYCLFSSVAFFMLIIKLYANTESYFFSSCLLPHFFFSFYSAGWDCQYQVIPS